jgi:transcriptional regulator with XRE-family HTH domain
LWATVKTGNEPGLKQRAFHREIAGLSKQQWAGRADRSNLVEAPAQAQSVQEIRIGPKLKQVRSLRGLTMRELAETAGCSESLLSKIENSKANPSVATLHRLALALGTNIGAIFPGGDGAERVVSSPQDRPSFTTQDGGIRIERLVSTQGIHLLSGYIHWIRPGAGYEGEVVQHQGEELGLVLEGEIELTVDRIAYRIRAGGSFHFRSELPHGYRNCGAEPARIIWVSTPPTF